MIDLRLYSLLLSLGTIRGMPLGCNVIRDKPVDVEIQSPQFQDPVIIQPPELTDGTTVDSENSPPLLVAGGETHTFLLNKLGKCPIRQVWIYTKDTFPMHGDWQIITPAYWSYKVTTRTTGPSIVITNDNLQVVDQVRIGILSVHFLEITELEAYSGCFEPDTPTDEVKADGKVNIWAIVAPIILSVFAVGIYFLIRKKISCRYKYDKCDSKLPEQCPNSAQ